MEHSFIVINSVELYEKYKFDLLPLNNEYFIWNLKNSNISNPNYDSIHKAKFGLSVEEKIKKLTTELDSGIPTEETIELNKNYFRSNKNTLLILKVNNENIGMAALKFLNSETGLLQSVFIKTSFRGKQYGKFLLNKIIEFAKNNQYKTIKLDTFPFMTNAINLYRNFGFEFCDHFSEIGYKEEKGKQLMAIYMKKNLEER